MDAKTGGLAALLTGLKLQDKIADADAWCVEQGADAVADLAGYEEMLAEYGAGLHVQQLQASQWKQPHEAIRIRQLLDKPVASLDGLSIDRLGYDTRLARRHAKDHWSDSDEEDGRFNRAPTADDEANEWDDSLEGKQRRILRTAADARFAKAPSVVLPTAYLRPLEPWMVDSEGKRAYEASECSSPASTTQKANAASDADSQAVEDAPDAASIDFLSAASTDDPDG